MYAFEAGELSAYRTSMQANMDCKEAIEQTINDYYGNNRLAAESAVKSILEKFSPERVAYVLANTINSRKTMTGVSPVIARNGQRAWMPARIMQLNSLLTV